MSDMDCLFCAIAAGDIPSKKVYEDDKAVVFWDIAPQAPVHLLCIPREHIGSVAEINGENAQLAAHLLTVVAKVAAEQGLDKSGYRVISNCGPDAQQSVGHLHFHILGGQPLSASLA